MESEQMSRWIALAKPWAALIIAMLLAEVVMDRNAGLPGLKAPIEAILIWLTGVALFIVPHLNGGSWQTRVSAAAGVLLALWGVFHLANITIAAKQDLSVADIGTQDEITDGVITCAVKNYKRSRHAVTDHTDYGWILTYAYVVDDQLYRQQDYTPKQYFNIGEHITVLYKLTHPAVARLVKPDEVLPSSAPTPVTGSPLLPKPNTSFIAC